MTSNHSMSQKPRILFLYTELAAYSVACFNTAIEHSIELSVVRWPVNAEAPFELSLRADIKVYNRNDYNNQQLISLVQQINPDLILTSGWVDKGYLEVCRRYMKLIPIVLLLDNPWKGTIKQHLASALGKFKIQRTFSNCWVPGNKQKQYAIKLGFEENKIKTGFYSADLNHFNQLFKDTFPAKTTNFPKRFLFVGRYLKFKGINELWQAFTEFRKEQNSDWELWCVGTGDLYPARIEAPGIKHFGFVQPSELKQIVAETGVFVLPSHKEPWGVVVHEYAACGFPLICSYEVGACEAFLMPGENGFIHQSASVEELKAALVTISQKSQSELIEMGKKSHRLAQNISPDIWSEELLKFLAK
jgi:glycosyltransferase involved in cell wall biosynthesis